MRRPALLFLGCLLLVAGVSALDGYDYYQTIEYAGCDQGVYQQDIVIHCSTGTAYNETAGGLEIWHIFVGDHCQADYDDVRFTNSTGAELAYYLWPDYSSESARFAVRLEGADQGGVLTIHYGNTTATTTSDGNTVYLVFDHFDGDSIDPAKWDAKGNIAVAGGVCTVIGSGFDTSGISSKQSFGTGVIAEIGHNVPPGSANLAQFIGFAPYLSYNSGVSIYYSGGSSYVWASGNGGAFTTGGTRDAYAISRIVRSPSFTNLYNTAGDLKSRVAQTGDYPITFNNAGTAANYLDYILVRTYSATPPAATIFSGEQETAAPPATAFTAAPTAGLAPLTVQFTDRSTGTPTAWSWSFGDGNTSTAQNPQHTYTAPGTYSVNLTATNEYGSTPATKLDYITVYGPITAQFSATPTGGTAPVAVQFTDLSTGGPTSWLWSFGDGNTSTAQNPAHTYTTAGTHTVTLTASHPYDSDTETKTSYITVAVLQPFPGLTLIPRDLTGTGLYTDINGNNRLDYNDLTVFFQNLAWAKTAQPIACFDFNGNGWLDYNDVITLFSTIMEEHT